MSLAALGGKHLIAVGAQKQLEHRQCRLLVVYDKNLAHFW